MTTAPHPGRTTKVLLLGMPRSGTTWLGKIFDSHPDVLYCHEPDNEFKLDKLPLIHTKEVTEDIKQYLDDYVGNIDNYCTLRTRGKSPVFEKSYLSGMELNRLKLSIARSRISEKLGLKTRPWNPVARKKPDSHFTVWKSVLSAGLTGTFLGAVDNCKVVYIIRHPCGQIASILNGEKGDKFVGRARGSESYHIFSMLLETDFAKRCELTIEQLESLEPIERLAWKWTLFNEKSVEDIAAHPGRGMVIRYDDLCNDPISTGQSMLEFSGLNFSSQVEDFISQSTSASGHSKSYYSVFKDPKISLNRWREDFTPEDIEKIRTIVMRSKAGRLFEQDF